MDLVQAHCSRAIYLKSGEVRSKGEPKTVIQDYLEDLFGSEGAGESDDASPRESEAYPKSKKSRPEQDRPRDLCSIRPLYNPNEYRWGDRRAVIFDYVLRSEDGPIRGGFERGQKISLDVSINLTENIDRLIIGFTVKTVDGRTVFGANRDRDIALPGLIAGDNLTVEFGLFVHHPGEYFLNWNRAGRSEHDNIAWTGDTILFICQSADHPNFGVADLGYD